jgi:hypothetical protein
VPNNGKSKGGLMEELHTDSIDGGHEASYGARSRARERAYSNRVFTRSIRAVKS